MHRKSRESLIVKMLTIRVPNFLKSLRIAASAHPEFFERAASLAGLRGASSAERRLTSRVAIGARSLLSLLPLKIQRRLP
jgi:hypothetical protein